MAIYVILDLIGSLFMYNYDIFNQLESMDFDGALVGLGIFIFIIALIALVIIVVVYILQSIALYKLANKNNLQNSWLAWLPVGNMYILGKLGFEIYADDDKKNEVFTWILLGCSAGSFLLDRLSVLDGLTSIASLGVLVFSVWAYYYIFNKINNKNAVLFTVLSAIFQIGGVILFFNKNRFSNEEQTIVKEDIKKDVKKEAKEKSEAQAKYCAYCGNKVTKTSKFCSKCGNQL